MTVDQLVSLLSKHADKSVYGVGLYIDAEDPHCVVIDGWVDLAAVAEAIEEWCQSQREGDRLHAREHGHG